jgi:hypothetical protein
MILRKCILLESKVFLLVITFRNAITQASKAKKFGIILGTLGRQGNPKILSVLSALLRLTFSTWNQPFNQKGWITLWYFSQKFSLQSWNCLRMLMRKMVFLICRIIQI